ncbi:MAG: hypothetical protein ABH950_08915 [Candidatus Altiarchaeota archaeon]
MKRLIIFFLVLAIILVSGCTKDFGAVGDVQKAIESGDPKECIKFENPLKGACLSGVAGVSKDPEICEMINERYQRFSCISALAASTGDEKICGKIRDSTQRDSCERLASMNTPLLGENATVT